MKRKAYDGIYNKFIKRGLDIVITGLALLILWPLYLILSLVIVVEDGFPVFYNADRGGYKNKTFQIIDQFGYDDYFIFLQFVIYRRRTDKPSCSSCFIRRKE